MAKRTFNQTFSVANDAAWQARVTEISDALTAVGFPKSADTGQINPATTTLPDAGSDAGYEIRYLNDSLHATAPVYLKITYGLTSGGTVRIKVNMGLSTNGSGTITGLNTGDIDTVWGIGYGASGALPSYFCAGEGFAWMSYMVGHGGPSYRTTMGTFGIFRTVDGSGAITSDGVALYYTGTAESNPGLLQRTISRVLSSVGTAHRSYTVVIGELADTTTATGPQVYRHWCPLPGAARLRHILTYVNPNIGAGVVLPSLAVVGSALDYITIGPEIGKNSATANANHCVALAWTGDLV